MKTFEQLESEFLRIDEDDTSAIIRFFDENKETFLSVNIDNKDTGIKYLWMLTGILNAAFERNDQKLIKALSGSTIKRYQEFSTQFGFNIKEDAHYKLLLINAANDHSNRRQYFLAYRIYKELHNIEKSNDKIREIYVDSKKRLVRWYARMMGIFGIILILIKYLLKYLENGIGIESLILGFAGGLLLIIYGIVEILINTKRENSSATNKP